MAKKGNSKKNKKPAIGGKNNATEVTPPKKREIRRMPPPPIGGIPVVNGHTNPLILKARCKRALCVALARCTEDDDVLIEAVRQAGICQKVGMSAKSLETDYLTSNELSGRGYAMGTGRAMQDSYYAKNAASVDACMDYAKALVDLISGGTDLEKARESALKEFDGVKEKIAKELAAIEAENKKQKAKSGKSKNKKGGKPVIKKREAEETPEETEEDKVEADTEVAAG